MRAKTIYWLQRLLRDGTAPASSVPKSVLPDLEGLVRTGVIDWERAGSGSLYRVGDPEALETICVVGPLDEATSASPKALAVARSGDAHRGTPDRLLVSMSAGTAPALWRNHSRELDVAEHTRLYGVASLVVRPNDDWRTDQAVTLVENLEMLYHPHRLGCAGTLLYYPGWIGGLMLEWLRAEKRAPRYTVCADFDPVGLSNYVRVRNSLGVRVQLYVPDNLEALLSAYGNANRLRANKRLLANLEAVCDPTLQSVLGVILKHGKGLDQEALLIDRQP